jgi:hypothetical protein
MLLSEWRKTAPNRECLSNKVLAVLKPVLADLGAGGDPECWVVWGEDPEFRYSVMAPTPAGLSTVAVRINAGSADGPRATGKLVRWGKLQISEVGVESAGGHRLIAVQVEGQVLKGMDQEADQVCEFVLGLLAGIDGRAFQPVGPVVVQTVAPVAAVAKPEGVRSEASQPASKPAPKTAPKPAPKAVPARAAASRPAKHPTGKGAPAAPAPADQPRPRKPARTPGGKTQAAWVAPHPIGVPVTGTKLPALLSPGPKAAPKPHAAPAAAVRSGEPTEGGPVWDVPEPNESLAREPKRPRTWIP